MTLITDHIPVAQGKSIMFTETVFEVLLHPSPAARLTAAWCLRCTASAVPAQLTALVDICTGGFLSKSLFSLQLIILLSGFYICLQIRMYI